MFLLRSNHSYGWNNVIMSLSVLDWVPKRFSLFESEIFGKRFYFLKVTLKVSSLCSAHGFPAFCAFPYTFSPERIWDHGHGTHSTSHTEDLDCPLPHSSFFFSQFQPLFTEDKRDFKVGLSSHWRAPCNFVKLLSASPQLFCVHSHYGVSRHLLH